MVLGDIACVHAAAHGDRIRQNKVRIPGREVCSVCDLVNLRAGSRHACDSIAISKKTPQRITNGWRQAGSGGADAVDPEPLDDLSGGGESRRLKLGMYRPRKKAMRVRVRVRVRRETAMLQEMHRIVIYLESGPSPG